MRLQRSQISALLLVLPAASALAGSVATADEKPVPRAAVPPAYPDVSARLSASPAPSTPASKGTEHAPVDGFDGMPHQGPYINDQPRPTKKKPAIVEELGAKKTSTPLGPKEEVLDGDKSVMQDPDRKLATGNKGTEGGVSSKDKERLAHEDKTGEKMEKLPESPKEAPPLPNSEQKQLHGDNTESETSSRALGAVGLEVRCRLCVSETSLLINYRNPPAFQTRSTIFLTRNQVWCPRRTIWIHPHPKQSHQHHLFLTLRTVVLFSHSILSSSRLL